MNDVEKQQVRSVKCERKKRKKKGFGA